MPKNNFKRNGTPANTRTPGKDRALGARMAASRRSRPVGRAALSKRARDRLALPRNNGGGGPSIQYGGAPAQLHAKYLQRAPQRTSTKAGVRLKNSELVSDVFATSGGFEVERYPVQPNNEHYKYLSQVAKDFEFYRVHSWAYHFVPRQGTNTDGVTYMVPEYDPQDPTPVDAQSAMIVPGATSESVPWPNTCHLSTSALNNYINPNGHGYAVANTVPGGQSQGGDIRLIDAGAFYMCTEGISGAKPLTAGTLYVSYDVEFSIPNSDSRLVSDGTTNKPITQPGTLLPASSCLISDPGKVNMPLGTLVNYFAPQGPIVKDLKTPETPYGDTLDFRNMKQYWDASNQYFKMAKGAWKFAARLATENSGGSAPTQLRETLEAQMKREVENGGDGIWHTIASSVAEHITTPGSLSKENDIVSGIVQTEAEDLIQFMISSVFEAGDPSFGATTDYSGFQIDWEQMGLGTA